ncbi:cyclase family protein [uncultured Megasphaera sp.]|uniref:cyclase family protein n=1 Tax=uncultured Megasphaera sp. TaxID=165188 RepID=UPI00259A82D4|nr:cyclase family protein [uncultured Megasphaera sp.]
MHVFLSYPLAKGQVVYPNSPAYLSGRQDIIGVNGSVFNTSIMVIPNHYGTHYDAPRHFNPEGLKITELPMDYFCFKGDDILILDVPKGNKEVITAEDVMPYKDQIAKAKLLLLRTGFEKQKELDPESYKYENPSAHPSFCKYLVENFPELKTIGLDSLSLGSVCNDYAIEAHHWLLGCYTDHFVTVIEDMMLSPLEGKTVKSITVAPIRALDVDSAPVTIIAEVE